MVGVVSRFGEGRIISSSGCSGILLVIQAGLSFGSGRYGHGVPDFQSVPNLVGWCAGYGGRRLGFFVAVVVGRVQVDRLCSVECSVGLGLMDLVVWI